jgi:hypothetical protein
MRIRVSGCLCNSDKQQINTVKKIMCSDSAAMFSKSSAGPACKIDREKAGHFPAMYFNVLPLIPALV